MIRRALATLGLILIGLLPAEAASLTAVSINQGPWPCDGKVYTNPWTNPTGVTVHITSMTQWIGYQQYVGGQLSMADITASARHRSGNFDVAWFLYDRYASPTGPHQFTTDFSPHSIDLAPGDTLDLHVACSPAGGPVSIAHVFTTFRYWVD